MSRRWSSLRWLFLALMLGGSCVYGQLTLGTITGRTIDPQGSAVADCSVTVTNTETGAVRTTHSDGEGVYSVPALVAGSYRVTVSKTGFQDEAATVRLAINQVLTQDFPLVIGTVTSTVNVSGSASEVALQKETHELGNVVSRMEIASLPVNGRNFISLATLGPGQQSASDAAGGTGTYFGTSDHQVLANGQPSTSTSFLQDGVDNLALFYYAANVVPDLDAIQEFSIETNGMSAKFSQPSVVNAISKSGTNSFHGFGYDYLQNEDLNANNWFSNFYGQPRGTNRFNQFGGGVGGPIKKDKTFFFFDYEGQRDTTTSPYSGRIPTLAERQGDFSDYLTGVPIAVGEVQKQVIYDPNTFNQVTGEIRPFPGNIIPADRLSSFATLFNKFFPAPASTISPDGSNYRTTLRSTNSIDNYLGRGDQYISSNDRLYGLFLSSSTPASSPTFTPGIFGRSYDRSGINAALEETHVISPNAINTARVGYNRSIFFLSQIGAGTKDWVQEFGLKTLNPTIEQNSPPGVSINGCCGLGDIFAPQGARQNRYQFSDEINYLHGKHQLFAGVDVVRNQFNGDWALANNGSLTFNGQFTSNHAAGSAFANGLGLADYELGLPSSAIGAEGNTVGAFRETDTAAYIQDNWRVRTNLVLNLGFRYQYSSPPADKYGRAGTFDLATATAVPGPWDPNYKNFAPRVGLAYSLNSKTVIRSGYGIYYTSTPYNVFQFSLANPPNFLSQSFGFDLDHPTPVSSLFPPITPGSSILSPFVLDKHNPTPYVEQWNFNIQRSLPSNMLLTVAYVGNASHHLSVRSNPNQPSPDPDPLHPTSAQTRRPFPALGDVLAQYDQGNAHYNALQVSLQKHFSSGFSFLLSYTYSKAMDMISGDGGQLYNGANPKAYYAVSDGDRTHIFTASYIYELPFGPGKRYLDRQDFTSKYLLGGWQLNGITTLETGLPFSVTAPDQSPGFTGSTFADRVCDGNLSGGQQSMTKWFDTSCFQVPPFGRLGNSGRNILRMDGVRNWNVSLFKNTPLAHEGYTLQFRAEAFNVFNQHDFLFGGQTGVTDAGFGQAQFSEAPRVLQLALKFLF